MANLLVMIFISQMCQYSSRDGSVTYVYGTVSPIALEPWSYNSELVIRKRNSTVNIQEHMLYCKYPVTDYQ